LTKNIIGEISDGTKKSIKKLLHVNGAAIDFAYMEEAPDGYLRLIIRVHPAKGNTRALTSDAV